MSQSCSAGLVGSASLPSSGALVPFSWSESCSPPDHHPTPSPGCLIGSICLGWLGEQKGGCFPAARKWLLFKTTKKKKIEKNKMRSAACFSCVEAEQASPPSPGGASLRALQALQAKVVISAGQEGAACNVALLPAPGLAWGHLGMATVGSQHLPPPLFIPNRLGVQPVPPRCHSSFCALPALQYYF